MKFAIFTKCTERDSAAKVLALTAKSKASTKTLDTSVRALVAGFAVFQVGEAARITVEIEVFCVAAGAEVAPVAAEAAVAEAARAAAAKPSTDASGVAPVPVSPDHPAVEAALPSVVVVFKSVLGALQAVAWWATAMAVSRPARKPSTVTITSPYQPRRRKGLPSVWLTSTL